MPEEKKYASQQKHLRTKYVRFPLDLKPDVLEAFKAKCDELGTTPTTEIKKFINTFISEDEAADQAAFPLFVLEYGKSRPEVAPLYNSTFH